MLKEQEDGIVLRFQYQDQLERFLEELQLIPGSRLDSLGEHIEEVMEICARLKIDYIYKERIG